MSEKEGKPRFEVIRGSQDFVMELSIAVQNVLQTLPDERIANYEKTRAKRSEVLLWTNEELLSYLKGEDLFKDEDTASMTWAVIEVIKGKITPAI